MITLIIRSTKKIMSEKYPELDKELIEITEEEIEKEEDIFPLIDYEEKNNEISDLEDPLEKLLKDFRRKIISIIRSKISYEN